MCTSLLLSNIYTKLREYVRVKPLLYSLNNHHPPPTPLFLPFPILQIEGFDSYLISIFPIYPLPPPEQLQPLRKE